ncbi:MAG: CotH kinase family protein [Muribaculaceae bacterium]|nr:CotH kinase family protein [Muribaculaceae bacterium]
MKKLLSIICIATVATSLAAVQARNVYVYRNDGKFDHRSTDNEILLTHSLSAADSLLMLDGDAVPLGAVDSIVVRHTDVPVLRFTFPDNPDATWVTDKENYIAATLDIEGNGMAESQNGLSLSVKGRGNSSWSFPKKPMRLKFGSKTSICGFTKAKSYVLLADFLDPSLMRNAAALWIARRMGVKYSNSFMPCHVYVNDRYAGAYLLTEKIGINKASVDIDEDTGVLIEMSTEYDEPYKFRSAIYNLPVMIKDPDFAELEEDNPDGPTAAERLAIWQEDFNNAEAEAVKLYAAEYFDMQSFVDYITVYDIALNNEIGHPKSCYIYKEAPGKEHKYKFGPIWDFDIAFNTVMIFDGEKVAWDPEGTLWVSTLIKDLTQCSEFMPLFEERFNYFEHEIYPEFLEWFDSYARTIEPLARMNGLRWLEPYNDGCFCREESSFDNVKQTAALKAWIEKRVAHIRALLDQGRFR